LVGKWAIGLYLGGAAMASMYGAASSLMAVLVWVYYSALIFFLGAEFTYVYAHEYGTRVAHIEDRSIGLSSSITRRSPHSTQ
jgi:membrane protein